MTTRILIEQSEGLTVEWQVIDGDVETLFVDYSELVARAKGEDIDYIRNVREDAIAWGLDRVVTDIDRITTEEAGFKIL